MNAGVDVYRPAGPNDDLACGDIAYLTLARVRAVGEAPPGDAYDPVGRVPAYPRPSIVPLAHDREVALDAVFGLVVTHSCEIDRQRNLGADEGHWDCRITVAPIVPEPRVRLAVDIVDHEAHWEAIAANAPVASLYLPPVDDLSQIDPALRPDPWPRAFADLRGLATVSRAMVRADRLMSLNPAHVGLLQRQLARFFTWRDIARHELVESLVGRRIVSALPVNPKGTRLHVAFVADDGTTATLEITAG